MTSDIRVGWVTVVALAALALVLSFCSISRGAEYSLAERLEVSAPAFASAREESVNARELAQAIAAVPGVTREWAALILTIAVHESGLSARIASGDCRSRECDGGRAWGLWQAHRNAHNSELWGSVDVRVQALSAARTLRGAFYTCQRSQGGKLRPDWVARTISAYAGRNCDAIWPGLEERLVTFRRILTRL